MAVNLYYAVLCSIFELYFSDVNTLLLYNQDDNFITWIVSDFTIFQWRMGAVATY